MLNDTQYALLDKQVCKSVDEILDAINLPHAPTSISEKAWREIHTDPRGTEEFYECFVQVVFTDKQQRQQKWLYPVDERHDTMRLLSEIIGDFAGFGARVFEG